MRRYGDTTYRVRAALRSWAQVQAVPTKISSALQPFSLFFHRAALALRPTAEEEKQNEVEIAKCKIDGGLSLGNQKPRGDCNRGALGWQAPRRVSWALSCSPTKEMRAAIAMMVRTKALSSAEHAAHPDRVLRMSCTQERSPVVYGNGVP